MHGVTLLAHDIGTSGVKTFLVDANLREIDSASTQYPTLNPQAGWFEQDPALWRQGMVKNTRALVERQPGDCAGIGGIGLSGHMLGCLPVDSSGTPLYPAMIHSDSRATTQCRRVAEAIGEEEIYRISGNILDPKAPLCKMLWLAEHRPDIFNRTARILQSKDFAAACLTGNIDSTDFSDASHAQVLDIRRKQYAHEVLATLGIPVEKLPSLRRGTDTAGTLTPEAAGAMGLASGIPVTVGGGDGACANAGAGITAAGEGYCNLGTTAWIATLWPEPFIDTERRLFNILSLDGETSGVFGTMQAAGRALEWVRTLVRAVDMVELGRMITSITAGSDGLIFLPYLEGERSPVFDPDARGVFFGLTSAHGPAHLARAVMEGVTFALRSIMDAFRSFTRMEEMPLIGGGANSTVWRRMIADILDIRLYSTEARAENVTALGAAMAAAVGIGLYDSLTQAAIGAGACMQRNGTEPHAPVKSEAYERNYRTFTALYPRLRDLFGDRR